jgi:hypothetical protein
MRNLASDDLQSSQACWRRGMHSVQTGVLTCRLLVLDSSYSRLLHELTALPLGILELCRIRAVIVILFAYMVTLPEKDFPVSATGLLSPGLGLLKVSIFRHMRSRTHRLLLGLPVAEEHGS